MQITMHQAPIIIADTAPEVSGDVAGKWAHTLTGEYFYRWFNTVNRRWYTYNGSEWEAVGEIGVTTEIVCKGLAGDEHTITIEDGIITNITTE